MTSPRKPRLIHTSIKVRVSVDPSAYAGLSRAAIVDDVRELVIQAVSRLPGVVSARRDSDLKTTKPNSELGNN